MKLLFVSNLFPDTTEPYRGLDNATLLHHLADRWQIRVLALRPALPFRSGAWRPREQDLPFAPEYLAVPYIPKFGSRWNHRIMARTIRPLLRVWREQGEFEVVLSSWMFPDSCAVAALSSELNFPFVAIAQGSDVHQYLQISVRRRIMADLLPRAAAVVTRSGELARLLGEAGLPRERLHPVYNGVDLALFQPGDRLAARSALRLPPEAPLILFVGNFYAIKNPFLAVRTLPLLSAADFPAPPVLVIVGGGPLESDVRQLADQLGVGDRVMLAGRTDAAGVARCMQAADVLLLPSQNEGVPNVILEAFACGLPVVASRVGGIPEVHPGDHAGRLVEPIQPEPFARALRDVLLTSTDRARLRDHALQFSWPRAAAACHELLSQARR